MSANRATFVTLFSLIIAGIVYFIYARSLQDTGSSGTIGSGYFPQMLAIILILLCIISFFQTLKKEDKKIPIPHLKMSLVTIGLILLYLLSWSFFGYFYLNTFLFLFVLFVYFKRSKKHILVFLVLSIAITFIIYQLFEKLLYIRF